MGDRNRPNYLFSDIVQGPAPKELSGIEHLLHSAHGIVINQSVRVEKYNLVIGAYQRGSGVPVVVQYGGSGSFNCNVIPHNLADPNAGPDIRSEGEGVWVTVEYNCSTEQYIRGLLKVPFVLVKSLPNRMS
jgi:hypothetical protein